MNDFVSIEFIEGVIYLTEHFFNNHVISVYYNINSLLMDFKPQYYKTHPLSLIVKLESVSDKHGNIKFAVTFSSGQKENKHFLFKHLSSAIDFIESNFN